MKVELSRQIFEYSNIKFHEKQFIASRVVPCRLIDVQTDVSKLIVAFRNFANIPKNYQSLQLGPSASQLKMKVDTSQIQDYSFTATPNLLGYRGFILCTLLVLSCL